MDEESLNSRLSRISTIWSTFEKAQQGAGAEARSAQLDFIQRYQGAAYRYLLGAVKDAGEADDLFQQFALRFMQGAFRRADRHRGRFRDYLRASLYRSVADHFRQRQKRPQQLDPSIVQPVARSWDREESERQFTQSWREELLARAWCALAETQQRSELSLYAVLRLRTECPEATSEELAQRLNAQLRPRRPFSSIHVRKCIERARCRFAELLIDEVRRSLEAPSPEELEQELIELGLMPYCRTVLRRRQKEGSASNADAQDKR